MYGISREPDYITIKKTYDAIPQYKVGHIAKMDSLKKLVEEESPHLRIIGNYIDGSGIPHIINYAKREVEAITSLAQITSYPSKAPTSI